MIFSGSLSGGNNFPKTASLKTPSGAKFQSTQKSGRFFQKSNLFEHCLTSDYRKSYFE
jgi:hypothetical protein